MVIIDNNTETIYIPKHTSNLSTELTMKIENNLTHSKFEYAVKNTNVRGHFYTIDVPEGMLSVDIGEYTYELWDNKTILEFGLMNVGNYNAKNTEYNSDKKTVQYNGKK